MLMAPFYFLEVFMCGIAGWIDYNRDLRSHGDIINKMTNTMIRRGPDDQGIYLEENVCLMHRRLIVIDPENGKQPMTLEKGNAGYTIVITESFIIQMSFVTSYQPSDTALGAIPIPRFCLRHLCTGANHAWKN
jgi:hypothetical protein